MQINYKSKVFQFLGRNSVCKCDGLSVQKLNRAETGEEYAYIAPLTSRGQEGRCWIEVPQSSYNDLVTAIQGNALEKVIARIHELQPSLIPALMKLDTTSDEIIERFLKGTYEKENGKETGQKSKEA